MIGVFCQRLEQRFPGFKPTQKKCPAVITPLEHHSIFLPNTLDSRLSGIEHSFLFCLPTLLFHDTHSCVPSSIQHLANFPRSHAFDLRSEATLAFSIGLSQDFSNRYNIPR
jgi:hypothetical protein